MAITLQEFAEATGCSLSMVSYMRSGQRSPSAALAARIRDAYDLDSAEWLDALGRGPEYTGQFLWERVFDADTNATPVSI